MVSLFAFRKEILIGIKFVEIDNSFEGFYSRRKSCTCLHLLILDRTVGHSMLMRQTLLASYHKALYQFIMAEHF